MNLAKNNTNEVLTKFMNNFDLKNHQDREFTRVIKKFFNNKEQICYAKNYHRRRITQSIKGINILRLFLCSQIY